MQVTPPLLAQPYRALWLAAADWGMRTNSWTVWSSQEWSGKEKLDFLLRTLKRIAARVPPEACSPGRNACAPYCNRAPCA